MSHSLEKLFRVYDDNQGVYFQVGPDADCPDDLLLISTKGDDNERHYGKIFFQMTKEEAKLLAKALNELAEGI